MAGSLALNLLLLAGVVIAMRAPALPPAGKRHALVTVAITPKPRRPSPPPSSSPAAAAARSAPPPLAPLAPPRPSPPFLAQTGAPAVLLPAPPAAAEALRQPAPSPRPATAAPIVDADGGDALDGYRRQLWQRILDARPRGVRGTGMVTIRFRINRQGALLSSEVAGSSGGFVLDRLALQAVRRAAPFPPPPADLQDAALVFSVPVAFHD